MACSIHKHTNENRANLEGKRKSLSCSYENQISWIERYVIQVLPSILANYEAVIQILQWICESRKYDDFLTCFVYIVLQLPCNIWGMERKGKFKFSSSIFLTERSTIIIVMVYHFGKYKTITLFCNIYPISFVSNAFYINFSSHFVLIFGEIRIRSAGSMTEIVGNGIAIYNFKFTMEFYGNYNFKFAMCNFKFTQVYA